MSLIRGDAIHLPLADNTVDLIVTSPPYFALRSYSDGGEHYDGQIGSEATPQAFLDALWAVTAECRRVLKPTGSIWVNLGDKYAGGQPHSDHGTGSSTLNGHGGSGTKKDQAGKFRRRADFGGIPAKSLMGLPWRYAIGCIDELDLILRAEVIWSKPNGLPESVTDRVRRSHEQWFMFTKEPRYFAAVDEVREAHGSPIRPVIHEPLAGRDAGRVRQPGNTPLKSSPMGSNPLGKLPGSVWTINYELWDHVLSGPIRFCPRCGRDLAAGNSPAILTPKDTAANGSPTLATGEPTDSPTSCSSVQSPMGSPSTTCAETEPAATPTTSKRSPSASTSSEGTHPPHATQPNSSASTVTSSPRITRIRERTAGENAACVCEIGLAAIAPSSVWEIPSEPLKVPDWLGVDHFAAFPQEWPRRIILGWSPSGICVECGEGRRPVVEKELVPPRSGGTKGGTSKGLPDSPLDATNRWASDVRKMDSEATITGYACACDEPTAPTRPAVVLDPFGGTGTVAMVARALGRYPVHIDLSRDYLRLARWRIYDSGHASKTAERTNRERQGVLL